MWHGFWGGVYYTFIGAAIIDTILKIWQKTAVIGWIVDKGLDKVLFIPYFLCFRFVVAYVALTFQYQYAEYYKPMHAAFNNSVPYFLFVLGVLGFILPKFKKSSSKTSEEKPK